MNNLKPLKLILLSILVAVLNVGISNIGYVNLVLIVTAVLLIKEDESLSIFFAVVGGFIFDVLMHNSIGETSFCILVGVIVFLLFKALVSSDSLVFKVLSVVILVTVVFASNAGISILIEDTRYSSFRDFVYWWKDVIIHSLIIGLFLVVSGGVSEVVSSEKKIRLK